MHRSATVPFVPSDANRIASGLAGTTFIDHDGLADSVAAHYIVRAWDASSGAQDGTVVSGSAFPTGPITVGTWTDNAGDTGTARFTGAAPWTVQATGGKTGPAVYATGQYTDNLCSALTSPPIRVQSGSVLSFATKYDIETNWDAGIGEVAEGPAFTNWTRLATVNYPDSLSNTGNACGFPTSFTGTVFSKYSAAPAYLSPDRSGSLSAYAGKLPYGVLPPAIEGQAMTKVAKALDAYYNGNLTPGCRDRDGVDVATGRPPVTPSPTGRTRVSVPTAVPK